MPDPEILFWPGFLAGSRQRPFQQPNKAPASSHLATLFYIRVPEYNKGLSRSFEAALLIYQAPLFCLDIGATAFVPAFAILVNQLALSGISGMLIYKYKLPHMDKEDIKLSDWYRILFGETPVVFLIEVFFRTLIIFLLLLVALRMMGKRMAGKITITEMAVMLTIGAIISVPMQIPERGLLVGVLSLTCAVAFQRGYNWLAFKSHAVEKYTQGSMDIVVEDGVILLDKLAKNRVSVNQLLSSLRRKKVVNLGSVERVYMEAGGSFSIFEAEKPKPGLPLLPSFEQTEHFMKVEQGWQSCTVCGFTRKAAAGTCPSCHYDKWTPSAAAE